MSFGLGLEVTDPFELGDEQKALVVDGYLQHQFLSGAESTRYRLDGSVTSLGAVLTYRF